MKNELDRILRRGVAEVIIEEELRRLLELGNSLRLKEGFDPSSPDIHLGHVVGLRKLRQFQELGHKVILIVGDWTAQIGDPSGESQTRPMLTPDEVKVNAETYMKQFFKVVDRSKTEIRWQSEWFGKFTLADVISLTSKFTVAQVLAREDFSQRQAAGRPIALTELLYPLLQSYDSVVIEADVEFGGIDQKFNCLMGRELQQMMGQQPQQIFFTPLLVGTDGQMKMSKSLGNYIAVEDPPKEMYGKVMSIPDSLIMDYFELVTDVSDEELTEFKQQLATDSVNPMELKKRLAREIVAEFHITEAALNAEGQFERVVQKRNLPEDIVEVQVSFQTAPSRVTSHVLAMPDEMNQVRQDITKSPPHLLPTLLLNIGLVQSSNEGRRLINQGAVRIDGEVAENLIVNLRDGMIIKAGKRRWIKIVNADTR